MPYLKGMKGMGVEECSNKGEGVRLYGAIVGFPAC